MRLRKVFGGLWWLYILWGLFVNACDQWLIGPLAQDYAMLGVLAVAVIVVIWLTSIPRHSRKRWITFTIFSLLVGNGFSGIALYPTGSLIPLGLLMVFGLILLTWWFARVPVGNLILGVVVLGVANLYLPLDEWPFLTHFSVVYSGRLSITPTEIPALPFTEITTPHGQALVTIENFKETAKDVQDAVKTAGDYPDSLHDILTNYHHRYTFVTLGVENGKFVHRPSTPQELASVNPNDLTSSFLPFSRAKWGIESGQPVMFTTDTVTPRNLANLALDAANLPKNTVALAEQTQQQEMLDWNSFLTNLGVSPVKPELYVSGGKLIGTYNGKNVDLPVDATAVLGTGAFTAEGSHEILLQGANLLQIVSVDGTTPKVVTTYQGNANMPLPNDLAIGPIDDTGRDVILVNSQPAYILQANTAGWKILYTAPSQSLRFEGSVQFANDKTPEIITDDPSYIRDTPTRYFSSYTYQNGQLERNWRVYRTNVVNVRPVQFTSGGDTYIVAAIYATGKYIVLKRHMLPVVPLASGALGLAIVIGWITRLVKRGGRPDAQA